MGIDPSINNRHHHNIIERSELLPPVKSGKDKNIKTTHKKFETASIGKTKKNKQSIITRALIGRKIHIKSQIEKSKETMKKRKQTWRKEIR